MKQQQDKGPVGFSVSGVISLAGGPSAVAAKLGVTIQSIAKWRYIPSRHARDVAIMAGLPIEIVRPDCVRPVCVDLEDVK